MGYASYSADLSDTLKSTARSAGYTDTFTHDADIKSGRKAAAIHPDLDPKNIKGVRESRDSAAHPTSKAVAIGIDTSGSMASVPKVVFDKFPTLMATIIKHGALEHPQVLFSAINDVKYDKFPFQVGQFESDGTSEKQISDLILEGGGGGNRSESYNLFLFFLARLTSIDCFEKRGEKGYAFIVCDEETPPPLLRSEVKSVFGLDIQADIPFADLVEEASEKYEIFVFRPKNTSHGQEKNITTLWQKLFPQRVIEIDDENTICDAIALSIAACEGTDLDAIEDDLVKSGSSKSSLTGIKSGLVPYVEKGLVKKGVSATGDLALSGAGTGDRL